MFVTPKVAPAPAAAPAATPAAAPAAAPAKAQIVFDPTSTLAPISIGRIDELIAESTMVQRPGGASAARPVAAQEVKPPPSVSEAKPPVSEPAKPVRPAESPGNLLERLKQQAAERLANESRQTGLDEQQRRTLSKALSDTFSFLSDFTNHVNTLKPDVPNRHFIGDQVKFDGMAWAEGSPDFRLLPGATADRVYERVSLRYVLAGKQNIVVERDHPQSETFAQTLKDYGLVATTKDFKNNLGRIVRTRFEIKPEIVGGLVFLADYATGSIRLTTRNVQRLGVEEYSIPRDALTEATMEDLALLVLGTSRSFVQRFKRIL